MRTAWGSVGGVADVHVGHTTHFVPVHSQSWARLREGAHHHPLAPKGLLGAVSPFHTHQPATHEQNMHKRQAGVYVHPVSTADLHVAVVTDEVATLLLPLEVI